MDCQQIIKGRRCHLDQFKDGFCVHHQDQSFYARVGHKCGVPKRKADAVVTEAAKEFLIARDRLIFDLLAHGFEKQFPRPNMLTFLLGTLFGMAIMVLIEGVI